MKHAIVMLAAALAVAAPSVAAPENFAADNASPFRRISSGKGETTIVRFTGSARLSGRFLVAWETLNQKTSTLRVIFRPDSESAAILPHAAGSAAVDQLLLSNREQAVAILLTPEAAQRLLARELLGAQGRSTVVVSDYQAVIDCDHRWYMARLVSASQDQDIVLGARENLRPGC